MNAHHRTANVTPFPARPAAAPDVVPAERPPVVRLRGFTRRFGNDTMMVTHDVDEALVEAPEGTYADAVADVGADRGSGR